jgi:hypothetical protein
LADSGPTYRFRIGSLQRAELDPLSSTLQTRCHTSLPFDGSH